MDSRAVIGGVIVQVGLIAATGIAGPRVSPLALLGALTVGGFATGVLSHRPESARFDGAATMLVGTFLIGAGLLALARFRVGPLPAVVTGGMFGGLVVGVLVFMLVIPFVGLYGAGCAVVGAHARRRANDGIRWMRQWW